MKYSRIFLIEVCMIRVLKGMFLEIMYISGIKFQYVVAVD